MNKYSVFLKRKTKVGELFKVDMEKGRGGKNKYFTLAKWQPTPVFFSGKSHGQRSPWQVIVHRVAK